MLAVQRLPHKAVINLKYIFLYKVRTGGISNDLTAAMQPYFPCIINSIFELRTSYQLLQLPKYVQCLRFMAGEDE